MSDLDEFYKIALELVEQSGKFIGENMSKGKTIRTKSFEFDIVTETDQMVENMFMNGIFAKFPDHKFIGEEGTAETKRKIVLTDSPTWIIDPVDGTINFVHTMPHTCVSVALYVNKICEIGIVYNPALNQLFTARRGQGAFYNGRRIRVSGQTEMNKSLAIMEFGLSKDPEKVGILMENISRISSNVHGMRALGSCALHMCMIAMGAADLMYDFGIHCWDIAAGDLIIREAGGVCIDPAGGELDVFSRRVLCAASAELAQQVAKMLLQYYPERD